MKSRVINLYIYLRIISVILILGFFFYIFVSVKDLVVNSTTEHLKQKNNQLAELTDKPDK